MNSGPEQEIAPMYNQVDFTIQGWAQGSFEVGEEIVPATAAFDPGFERIIKTQMRIRDQQNSNSSVHHPQNIAGACVSRR
jgi:hypothetical protein